MAVAGRARTREPSSIYGCRRGLLNVRARTRELVRFLSFFQCFLYIFYIYFFAILWFSGNFIWIFFGILLMFFEIFYNFLKSSFYNFLRFFPPTAIINEDKKKGINNNNKKEKTYGEY